MTRIPVYKPNTATISNTDPPFFKAIFPEHTCRTGTDQGKFSNCVSLRKKSQSFPSWKWTELDEKH